jgi:hypothetical protein
MRLKRGDILTSTRGDLTALVWKDKREVYILTNMQQPPTEGNFCGEHRNALKPVTVDSYNKHTGYIDKSDHMANSYSISRRTFKWTKKLFFHLLDLTILSSWILLSTCGAKNSRDFQVLLVRNMIDEVEKLWCLHSPTVGRPSSAASKLDSLEVRHRPGKGNMQHYRACLGCGVRKRSNYN